MPHLHTKSRALPFSPSRPRLDSAAILAGAGLGLAYVATNFTNGAGIMVGGLNIYPFDAVAVALGSLGAFATLARRRFSAVEITFLLILALAMLQFARGYLAHGSQAGVEFRGEAYALFPMFFLLMKAREVSRRDLAICLGLLAGAATVVYAGRYFGAIGLSQFDVVFNLGTFREFRYVDVDGALALCFFAVACVSLALYRTLAGAALIRAGMALVGLGLAVVTMHRSVWVAGAAGLVLLLVFQLRHRLANPRRLIIPLLFVAVAVAAMLPTITSSLLLEEAISETSQQNSTLNWRVAGWQALLDNLTPATFAMGQGYGADWGRWILLDGTGFVYINNSAHNFYLAILLQLGILGLGLYLIFFWHLTSALMKMVRRAADPEKRALAALLLALLGASFIFFITYGNGSPTAVTLAFAAAFVAQPAAIPPPAARGRLRRTGARRLPPCAHRHGGGEPMTAGTAMCGKALGWCDNRRRGRPRPCSRAGD